MLKKAGIFFLLNLVVFLGLNAQKTSELGVFLGRSYYLGEINPKTHVGNKVGSFSIGGVLRYNLSERYTLKATVISTKIGAEDKNTEFTFNNTQRRASFEGKLTELATSIEFNFLPYQTGDKRKRFSPYIFVGLSYYNHEPRTEVEGFPNDIIVDNKTVKGVAYLFGPGIKLSLGRKVSFGFEWGFRKTGNDLIDGIENRIAETFESGKNYDNDWFVHSGFTLTYKFTDEGPCPAYNF